MADEKKKGPLAHKAVVDTTIVKPERVEALRAKAAERVAKERLAAAEAQLLEQFEREERQQGGLEEELVEIYIDLGPYATDIKIDGVVYFNGATKTVRASVADVIRDMMQATWRHQSIVDGKSENFYRQSRSQGVAAGGAVISHILRA
jgi:hypothetical protein